MRILVATDQWFPDFRGGSARVATETARKLAERGHALTVLAPTTEGRPVETDEEGVRVLRVLARGFLPNTFSDVLQTRRHARRLRRSHFDLSLAHQSTGAAGLLAAGLTAPMAVVYHASAPRELRFRRSRLTRGPRRLGAYALEPPLVLFERAMVSHASRLLVLSEFSRSLLEQDHPEAAARALRVSGGVDTAAFSPGDGADAARERLGVPRDVPLLLTVRRLEARMGLEQLLHAVARVLRSRDVTVAVVGGGTRETALRRLSAALALDRNVRFLGKVTDEELRDWYRAADLFVLPTVAYEGFGMVTAEALASGTPVVGTPVGATPELLGPLDPRLLAAAAEPEALAAAIAEVLEIAGPALRRRCREYACERFAWENAIRTWEDALRQAAEGSRHVASAA